MCIYYHFKEALQFRLNADLSSLKPTLKLHLRKDYDCWLVKWRKNFALPADIFHFNYVDKDQSTYVQEYLTLVK